MSVATDDDKKERRLNRSGAILAIVALMVPLIGVLLHFSLKIGRILPTKSEYLSLVHIILIVILTTLSLVVLFDVIVYIWVDLKRYDLLADYTECDAESDKKYSGLIVEFKICLWVLALFLLSLYPFIIIYSGEAVAIKVAMAAVFLLILVLFFIESLRKIKSSRGIWKKIGIDSIGAFAIKVIFSFAIAVGAIMISWAGETQVIDISNSIFGEVTIDNYGISPADTVSIKIMQEDSDIFLKDVSGSELTFAGEKAYHNLLFGGEKEMTFVFFDEQKAHYRYVMDLREMRLKDGKYRYVISVSKYNKTVTLINEFEKNGDSFIFTTSSQQGKY